MYSWKSQFNVNSFAKDATFLKVYYNSAITHQEYRRYSHEKRTTQNQRHQHQNVGGAKGGKEFFKDPSKSNQFWSPCTDKWPVLGFVCFVLFCFFLVLLKSWRQDIFCGWGNGPLALSWCHYWSKHIFISMYHHTQ